MNRINNFGKRNTKYEQLVTSGAILDGRKNLKINKESKNIYSLPLMNCGHYKRKKYDLTTIQLVNYIIT